MFNKYYQIMFIKNCLNYVCQIMFNQKLLFNKIHQT